MSVHRQVTKPGRGPTCVIVEANRLYTQHNDPIRIRNRTLPAFSLLWRVSRNLLCVAYGRSRRLAQSDQPAGLVTYTASSSCTFTPNDKNQQPISGYVYMARAFIGMSRSSARVLIKELPPIGLGRYE